MYRTIVVPFLTLAAGVMAFASTSAIPVTLAVGSAATGDSAIDYITFTSGAFTNLICPSGADGCGGAFQPAINAGTTQNLSAATTTTVWCVDYQLDVNGSSSYITDVTTLANIATPTDAYVRYANLTGTTPPGWVNTVTDPLNIEGGANSAEYRYTLAAALVSVYQTTPTTLTDTPTNEAIQEAIWYITYNTDYHSGATWPPFNITNNDPTCSRYSASNYSCWVQYAEANAATVNLNAWAVISGPANTSGTLLNPVNSSFQTFLVQVATPEPAYEALALLGVACLGFFVVSRRRRAKS